MKVIFLDIDGVLNVENWLDSIIFQNQYCGTNNPIRDKFGHLFDPNCVRYLEALCAKHNAKIIISSSWRYSGLATIQNMFSSRGIKVDVIDTTISASTKGYKKQFEELQKLTKIRFSSRVERGYEIQAYLNTHPEITNYVILDDDSDMLKNQEDHFVHCDPLYGIDYNVYSKADTIFQDPDHNYQ